MTDLPIELRVWRQTSAQRLASTPAAGGLRFDTDRKTLVVGDGATSGGLPLAREGARVYARRTTTAASETGDGTYATVKYDAEVLDSEGAFDPATGIFTAPFAGLLYYCGSLSLDAIGGSHSRVELRGNASNGVQWCWYANLGNMRVSTFITMPFAAAVELDAADTFRIQCGVFGSTKTVGFYGANSTSRWTELGLLLVPTP